MATETERIAVLQRCKDAQEKIRAACAACGRDPDAVTLMAVTKTVAPELVNVACSTGIHVLGENRVQEYLSKRAEYDPAAEVQFIGHLQTNKVKQIVGDVTLIHSVDSVRLAAAIEKEAAALQITQPVLLELNAAGEESKSGVAANALPDLLRAVMAMPHLAVKGLMTIPPPVRCVAEADAMFAQIAAIYQKLQQIAPLPILSMGMSGDYESAVRHGSTMVRLGSALFGPRVYPVKSERTP
ncbi:MAG: YggS family pyridoxal phosphate-dependent enzyme [Oscillospiraceae bacterium]|nr:YggS family pyridoxal phosphate-dependent enzyme [Oscillospiraceae bacterium]